MSPVQNLKLFLVSLPIFLGIDFLWLLKIAKNFYDQEFLKFERTIRWPPAILVYLLIPLGLLLFALPKAAGNPWTGAFWGGLYGLVVYGVYDLTNFALLAHWGLKLTVVDILWGTFLNGLMGFLLVVIASRVQ